METYFLIYAESFLNFAKQKRKRGNMSFAKFFGHRREQLTGLFCHCVRFPSLKNSVKQQKGILAYAFLLFWWTRGESNPCPKTSWYDLLRVQSVIWNSPRAPSTDRLLVWVAIFCVAGSMANRLRTCIAYLTLSPRSRFSSEERVALCHGTALRQPLLLYYC